MKTLIAIFIASSLSAYNGTLSGETVDGDKKICYYSTFQGTIAITINRFEACPYTVDF